MMEEFNSEKKLDRQRKKRFYNSIRQQIEFYLSDVNLSKDRFFSKLLEESPYVDIEFILQCNKIKKLTTDPKDIVRAIKKSNFLSITEDKTKIFRTRPVAAVTNADDCTIYAEDLPLEVDHDWLKNVFSTYGDVVYVSVPHYKASSKIKGFAFIQFDSPDSAKKALNAFRSMNSCLSSSMEPTELRSIQTFEGDKEVVFRKSDEIKVESIKYLKTQCAANVEEDEEPQKKKRRKNKEAEDCSLAISKPEITENIETSIGKMTKVKSHVPEKNSLKSKNAYVETKCDAPEIKSDTAEDSTSNQNDQFSDTEKSKIEDTDAENTYEEKHSRKRKRKKRKPGQVQTYGMQILSKQDWKKLRNKYLEEQKKKMHVLKQQLSRASRRHLEKYKFSQENDEKDESEMQVDESNVSESRVKYTPGVIVRLQLDQPIGDTKHFKNDVKRYADVEYIDVSKNDTVAYFRCSSNEAANQVLALNKWPNMMILSGDEELAYWEKIKLDRKEKIENKIRCNTRGKNKLIKKVEAALATHIKFPD